MLIAALLELKSRLMLPGEEVEELDELAPGRGRRGADRADARSTPASAPRAGISPSLHEHGQAFLLRCARLPEALRQVSLANAETAYDPAVLGAALGCAAAHARADRPDATWRCRG